MKLKSLRVRGLAPFIEESFVDLEAIPGKLIAVVGPNGAGKSTLLNLYPAATIATNRKFLVMPGRGSRSPLAALSVARDSFLEVGFSFGDQDYTVRHSIDGVSGKTDCSVTDGNGQAVLKGKSGVTEFLTWSAEHLLSPEVFFGGLFSTQRTRGMLGMDPAERKAVILKVMGLDRYERLSKVAGERKREAEKALAVAIGRLQELRGDAIAFCEEQIIGIEAEKRVADESLRLGEITLQDLRKKNAEFEAQQAEYRALASRHGELTAQVRSLRDRVGQLQGRIEVTQEILDDESNITEATSRSAELVNLINALKQEESELRVKSSELEGQQSVLYHRERDAAARRSGLERTIGESERMVVGKDAARSAAQSIGEFEESLAETESERDAALRDLERLQGAATTSDGGRIEFLRSELRYIGDGKAEDPVNYADSAHHADELAAKELAERPAEILRAKAAWRQADERAKEIADQLATLRHEADKLPTIEAAEKALGETRVALGLIDITEFESERAATSKAVDEVSAAMTTIRARIRTGEDEYTNLRVLAGKASEIQQAKSRKEVLLNQKSGLDKELEEAERKLDGVKLGDPPPTAIDLSPYERAIREAQSAATSASSRLAVANDALTRAKATETRRQELQSETAALGQDAADWKRLADDLGLKGLPALLVDASGPELTELANDLLRSSGDTRFALRVNTTPLDAKGLEREGCEIEIIDQRDGSIKTGASGGEEVFIDEALSESLTAMAVRHAGIKNPTLIRDETGAALDPAYSAAYIAMLRRTAEILDASVLYVSHNPDIQALADSRINLVGNGKLEFS